MKHLIGALLLFTAMTGLAAEKLEAITTQEQFGSFMEGYYKNPRPELVESAMHFLAGPGASLTTNENTARMMQASFACLFQRHPEKRAEWKKVIETLPDAGHTYLNVSMESSVEAMFQATPTVPEKNDMSWGCFFITGDTSYVQNVVLAMKHLGERKDLNKYLTAASAQWSLASISTQDDKVREVLQAAAKGADAQLAAAAREALSRPVGELRESMIATLREQQKAGVW